MIDVETRDGWRKLILNRPEKLNAVNAAMLTALLAALTEAEADNTTRALLLTGAGRGFCAGQELGPTLPLGLLAHRIWRHSPARIIIRSCAGCAPPVCRWSAP